MRAFKTPIMHSYYSYLWTWQILGPEFLSDYTRMHTHMKPSLDNAVPLLNGNAANRSYLNQFTPTMWKTFISHDMSTPQSKTFTSCKRILPHPLFTIPKSKLCWRACPFQGMGDSWLCNIFSESPQTNQMEPNQNVTEASRFKVYTQVAKYLWVCFQKRGETGITWWPNYSAEQSSWNKKE